MSRNLRSPRARWRQGCAMARHDALPQALRQWVIHAALPWSAPSVLRLWRDTLRRGGSETEALARLNAAEQATLRCESAKSKDPRGRTAGL